MGTRGVGVAVTGSSDDVRVPKTGELVARQLRRQIVLGEFAEGDRLPPETALIERFGISRPTLREAMRVLEAEGLVTVRRGANGGVRVSVPRVEVAARYAGLLLEYRGVTTADVFEAVAAIEIPLVGILAAREDVDVAARLRGLVAAEATADGPDALLTVQNDFHRLVVELAGNDTLRLMSGMLRHLVDTASRRMVASTGRTPASRSAAHTGSRAHRKLVDLIVAGDVAGAESLWRRHLAGSAAVVLRDSGGEPTVLDLLA